MLVSLFVVCVFKQREVPRRMTPTPSSRPLLCACLCCVRPTKPKVKCVLHWFQMMYSGRLSLFADGPASQYIPVTYDVTRVSCPVAIVYGGRDHLGKYPPSLRLSHLCVCICVYAFFFLRRMARQTQPILSQMHRKLTR